MLQLSSQSTPIYPGYVAKMSSSPYQFGSTPWKPGYGLKGCGCGPHGGCGCAPTTQPTAPGLRGLGQTGWLDQIAIDAGNWLSSVVGAPIQVGPTATGRAPIPTGIFPNWIPWAIGGIVVYKLLK